MLKNDLKNNIEVKEPIIKANKNSSTEQQLLYNLAVQTILGNIVRLHASEDKDRIVIALEYDDYHKNIKADVSITNKELFNQYFIEL